ncbi:hypothetical protein BDK51DRAFT_38823, partial [Blyttiomyces helicus]
AFADLHVFPGGAVDKADADERWKEILPGPELERVRRSDVPLRFYIAAIRETFEECGIRLFDPDVALPPSAVAELRHKVHDDATNFLNLPTTTGAVPAPSRLAPFSRWIGPKHLKSRFDTQFFLACVGSDGESGVAVADGEEILAATWLRPSEFLAKFERQEIQLLPPQFVTITELSRLRFADLQEYTTGVRTRTALDLSPWLPEVIPNRARPGWFDSVLPGDKLHSSATDETPKGARHRTVSFNDEKGVMRKLEYVRDLDGRGGVEKGKL